MSPTEIQTERRLLEFDGFRVDPVRRRVLRGSDVVPLTPKAFSILMALLEKRGELVEKEELIQRVWPDTFITEANLTQNVSSLRKALGERANDHRYVVTVPGRGYSFVAEVKEVARDQTGEYPLLSLPVPTPLPTPVPPPEELQEPPVPAVPEAAPVLPRAQSRRRPLLAGLVLGLVLAGTAVGFYLLLYKGWTAPPPARAAAGTRPAVAVLGFRNLAGDRSRDWLATALAEMLNTELSAGSQARMISGEDVSRVRQTLSLPPEEDPSQENLERIHAALGTDLVVVGSYLTLGTGKIRIDLRVLKTPEGETATSLAQAGNEDDLFELISVLGGRLRRALNWADLSPEQARAVQALQPDNPEASRLYAQGLNRLRAYDSRGASDFLQQAAQADPDSAVIRSSLSLAWIGVGRDAKAREEAAKAVELSAALPREERLAILAQSHEAENRWNEAGKIYRSLWTFYPDNPEYGLRLATSLAFAGRGAEALATVAELRGLPGPAGDDPRVDLTEAQVARRLGSPEQQLRAGTAAADKGRRLQQSQIVAEALLLQGDALFTMGRPDESVARFQEARRLFVASGNQAAVARVLNRIGAVLMTSGDLTGAERQYQEALVIARRLGSDELVAAQTVGLAFAAGYLGDLQRSRALSEQAHALFMELEDDFYVTRSLFKLGETLWEMGDIQGAQQRFEEVLEQSRKSGNRVEEARALEGLARFRFATGSLEEAQQFQEQAFQMAQSYDAPALAASYLAAVGQTLVRKGELETGRRRLERALETKRRVRDRMGSSQVLGMLSTLAYAEGEVGRAQRYAAEQETLARESRSSLVLAAALQSRGRLDFATGDIQAARTRLAEAWRLATSLQAALLANDVRLDLARLDFIQGKPADAARRAREAAEWFEQRGLTGGQSRALAVVSQALYASGRLAEARQAADQAHAISERSEDLLLQIQVVAAVAPVKAAAGERAAMGHLRWAITEADRIGGLAIALEARLVLGSLELQHGNQAAARALLEEVRRTAEARGLKGVARRAADLARIPAPPLG